MDAKYRPRKINYSDKVRYLDGTETCAVCGQENPSGRHYGGAITCESCKSFYKRSLQSLKTHRPLSCKGRDDSCPMDCDCGYCKSAVPFADTKPDGPYRPCMHGGRCQITEETRRLCKSCRFRACVRANMSTDATGIQRLKKAKRNKSSSGSEVSGSTVAIQSTVIRTEPHPSEMGSNPIVQPRSDANPIGEEFARSFQYQIRELSSPESFIEALTSMGTQFIKHVPYLNRFTDDETRQIVQDCIADVLLFEILMNWTPGMQHHVPYHGCHSLNAHHERLIEDEVFTSMADIFSTSLNDMDRGMLFVGRILLRCLNSGDPDRTAIFTRVKDEFVKDVYCGQYHPSLTPDKRQLIHRMQRELKLVDPGPQ